MNDEVVQFVNRVLHDPRVAVPRATVVDVGVLQHSGWAVVELNAAWGAASMAVMQEKCSKCSAMRPSASPHLPPDWHSPRG